MVTVNNKKICENCFKETAQDPCPHCGFSKSTHRQDPITLTIGSILNQRYMIGRVIGKGGFGITYLAYDLKLDTRLAVKEYYPMGMAIRTPGSTTVSVSNEQSEEPFKNGAEKFYSEAKMVAKFNGNPNIVSVHDFFYENDTVYFTMGYLEGETLKSYLKEKKITEGQAVKIMQDISNALMASHSMNILHRDISPDNIMLCDDGSIKLLDFGAARQVMAEQSQSLSVILKQGFAPLEQYQKKGKQGPWTDIYALGATIYHALTGDVLDDPMTRLDDDSAFEENRHGISEGLWNIIHKSLMLRIEDRYQDVFELKKDLNALEIKPETIFDVKEEVYSAPTGRTARAFGSTEEDPNATVLLSSGSEGGMGGNETVALSPGEAEAYSAAASRDNAPLQMQVQQPVPQNGSIPAAPVPQNGSIPAAPVPQNGSIPAAPVPQNGNNPAAPRRQSPHTAAKKQNKGVNPVDIILLAAPVAAVILALIFFAVGKHKVSAYINDPDNQTITEPYSYAYEEEEDEIPVLPDTYESSKYKYTIGYDSALYSVDDDNPNPVEFINEDGTHHLAVAYMGVDKDSVIIYDARDYADRIDANNRLLLPQTSYNDPESVQSAEGVNSQGLDYIMYEYTYTDDEDRNWEAELYLFNGKGDYGCYAVYSLVYSGADDKNSLKNECLGSIDSFNLTEAYDPGEYTIYKSDEYGIEFSTYSESDAEFTDDGSIFVGFTTDEGTRNVGVFPGEEHGADMAEMFRSLADEYYTDLKFATDMFPVARGRYNGYMVATTYKDSGKEKHGVFMALYTDTSDSKYKTYVIVVDDIDKDLDHMTEVADGFRFDGAPAVDLSGIDPSQAVSF